MGTQTDKWTEDDIPGQHGRTILVTGANSGLGLRTAEVLAGKGATVLLGCRSTERGERARAEVAGAAGQDNQPVVLPLDLGDLGSVRRAADTVRERTGGTLDLLINNAGLMGTPRGYTGDGFETQFGINHLGHAALTWLLMPALRGTPGARVVTVSSIAARGNRIDFDDPNFERRRYNPASAYGQAKLANQVFALELDRRLRGAAGVGTDGVLSVAAHPGYTATSLGSTMARSYRTAAVRAIAGRVIRLGEVLFAQDTRMGTLPQLYAATAARVTGGDYIGPDALWGARGYPKRTRPLAPARSEGVGSALWELTAQLTGVTPDPR